MRGLAIYLSWEMVGIHALTGLLFAAVNVLSVWALVPGHWPVALALLPLAIFSWWGWYAEGVVLAGAAKELRASAGRTPGA